MAFNKAYLNLNKKESKDAQVLKEGLDSMSSEISQTLTALRKQVKEQGENADKNLIRQRNALLNLSVTKGSLAKEDLSPDTLAKIIATVNRAYATGALKVPQSAGGKSAADRETEKREDREKEAREDRKQEKFLEKLTSSTAAKTAETTGSVAGIGAKVGLVSLLGPAAPLALLLDDLIDIESKTKSGIAALADGIFKNRSMDERDGLAGKKLKKEEADERKDSKTYLKSALSFFKNATSSLAIVSTNTPTKDFFTQQERSQEDISDKEDQRNESIVEALGHIKSSKDDSTGLFGMVSGLFKSFTGKIGGLVSTIGSIFGRGGGLFTAIKAVGAGIALAYTAINAVKNMTKLLDPNSSAGDRAEAGAKTVVQGAMGSIGALVGGPTGMAMGAAAGTWLSNKAEGAGHALGQWAGDKVFGASAASGVDNTTVGSTITDAAKKVGVDPGFMLAMAKQESGFNPNAKASTTSASGLFQFTDSTWKDVLRRHPLAFGMHSPSKLNPADNALAAALLTKDNMADFTARTGRQPTPTEMYESHFLGTSGAAKLDKARGTGVSAASILPQAAAANPSIFYDKATGRAKTADEVYQTLYKSVGSKASGYSAALANGANPDSLTGAGGVGAATPMSAPIERASIASNITNITPPSAAPVSSGPGQAVPNKTSMSDIPFYVDDLGLVVLMQGTVS